MEQGYAEAVRGVVCMKIHMKAGWAVEQNDNTKRGEEYQQWLSVKGNYKHAVATAIVSLACHVKKGTALNMIDKKRISEFVGRIGKYP